MEASNPTQNREKPGRKGHSGRLRFLLVFLIFLLFAGITWLNARLRFPWILAISLALTLLCGALFLAFRPGCTLAQAQRRLEEAGYTEVMPNPEYSRMDMARDGNPMVHTGYVLRGTKGGESQVFFVNPVNGEWFPAG